MPAARDGWPPTPRCPAARVAAGPTRPSSRPAKHAGPAVSDLEVRRRRACSRQRLRRSPTSSPRHIRRPHEGNTDVVDVQQEFEKNTEATFSDADIERARLLIGVDVASKHTEHIHRGSTGCFNVAEILAVDELAQI